MEKRIYLNLLLTIVIGSTALRATEQAKSILSAELIQQLPIPQLTRIVVNEKTQQVMLLQKGSESLLQASFDEKKQQYRKKFISLSWNDSLHKKQFYDMRWRKNSEILAVNQDHTLAIGYKYERKACSLYSYRIHKGQLIWADLINPFITNSDIEKKMRPTSVEFAANSSFFISTNHKQKLTVWEIDRKTGRRGHQFSPPEAGEEKDRSMMKFALSGRHELNTPEEGDRFYTWSRVGSTLEIIEAKRKDITSILHTFTHNKFTIGKPGAYISAFAMQTSLANPKTQDLLIGTAQGDVFMYLNQPPMQQHIEPISILSKSDFSQSNAPISAAAFSPDQQTMAIGTEDCGLYLMQKRDTYTGKLEVKKIKIPMKSPVQTLAFTKNHLLVGSRDMLYVFRLPNRTESK